MIYFWTALISLLPIFELRGAIPFAMTKGIPWYIAGPFAAAVNILVAPLCWLFLSTVHRLFYGPAASGAAANSTTASGTAADPTAGTPRGFSWYRRLFDRFVERTRQKLRGGIEKWGALGIAIFVAIPLPGTGAWTGTIGAWVLGIPKRKTFLAVILGVIAAGIAVTAVMFLGLSALRIFVKEM